MATLETRKPVAIKKGGERRVVRIARSRFAQLEPGTTVTLTVRLHERARYHVNRSSRIPAVGRVENQTPNGVVPTVDRVTLRNPHVK